LEYFKKEDLHPYPDMWKPYEKLSNYLNVSEEKLLITRGVEGAFKQVLETLVDKGDSVGILAPTCRMYYVYAEVYGIDVIEIKGEEPDYKISVEQVKKVVPNIKVLFLDNPKSHLPSYFTHEELNTIIRYCEEYKVVVFLDEVYIGWGIDSYLPYLNNHNNLIISSSFSKIAFASLRVGWLVTNKELKKQIETLRESCELDYFACKSIEFIIDNQDYIKDLKKKILDTKKRWYNELSKSNKFKVYDSKSYVLRLYSKNKELIKKTYDKLYNERIIISIVDDVNLVFSVTNNKKIEEVFFKELSSRRNYL
jgi:histidinol-phosphate aminotransferase